MEKPRPLSDLLQTRQGDWRGWFSSFYFLAFSRLSASNIGFILKKNYVNKGNSRLKSTAARGATITPSYSQNSATGPDKNNARELKGEVAGVETARHLPHAQIHFCKRWYNSPKLWELTRHNYLSQNMHWKSRGNSGKCQEYDLIGKKVGWRHRKASEAAHCLLTPHGWAGPSHLERERWGSGAVFSNLIYLYHHKHFDLS